MAYRVRKKGQLPCFCKVFWLSSDCFGTLSGARAGLEPAHLSAAVDGDKDFVFLNADQSVSPLVTADNYDARYLDPKSDDGVGMIVGLKKKDATVRDANTTMKSTGFFMHYAPSKKSEQVTVAGDTVTVPDQRQYEDIVKGRRAEAKAKKSAFKGISVKTEAPVGSQGGAPKAVSTSADTSAGGNSTVAQDSVQYSQASVRKKLVETADTEPGSGQAEREWNE